MALSILLIDSDETRAKALKEKLSGSGFAHVMHIQGGDLARAVERAQPDLVIVDMALPDRDALEDIRAISSASPVVMFAGTDDPAFAREAIAARKSNCGASQDQAKVDKGIVELENGQSIDITATPERPGLLRSNARISCTRQWHEPCDRCPINPGALVSVIDRDL